MQRIAAMGKSLFEGKIKAAGQSQRLTAYFILARAASTQNGNVSNIKM